MKSVFIILSSFLFLSATAQDSTGHWQTIGYVIGCEDTVWREGRFHALDTLTTPGQKIEVQFRSNGYLIQQRKRYMKP